MKSYWVINTMIAMFWYKCHYSLIGRTSNGSTTMIKYRLCFLLLSPPFASSLLLYTPHVAAVGLATILIPTFPKENYRQCKLAIVANLDQPQKSPISITPDQQRYETCDRRVRLGWYRVGIYYCYCCWISPRRIPSWISIYYYKQFPWCNTPLLSISN